MPEKGAPITTWNPAMTLVWRRLDEAGTGGNKVDESG
jgi:hypothetical protein